MVTFIKLAFSRPGCIKVGDNAIDSEWDRQFEAIGPKDETVTGGTVVTLWCVFSHIQISVLYLVRTDQTVLE